MATVGVMPVMSNNPKSSIYSVFDATELAYTRYFDYVTNHKRDPSLVGLEDDTEGVLLQHVVRGRTKLSARDRYEMRGNTDEALYRDRTWMRHIVNKHVLAAEWALREYRIRIGRFVAQSSLGLDGVEAMSDDALLDIWIEYDRQRTAARGRG